ncbi:hypothetical protein [Novosphingobium arvoryzae]|uniref:hypothetical protein n=1 Tax=Novosphingobium arvoryzae TaxID=1256514 RepID=UPI0035B1F5AD
MADPVLSRLEIQTIIIECASAISAVNDERISPGTDLVFELGLAGDDGVDLIDAIRASTGALLGSYDFYNHFGPEAAFAMHPGESLTVAQLVDLIEDDLCGR